MPEFEKIGKVLDEKVKGFSPIVRGQEKELSALQIMELEEKSLYEDLGRCCYERESGNTGSLYEDFITKINAKKQEIIGEKKRQALSRCVQCGGNLSEGAKFCPLCGTKVIDPEDSVFCPTCGKLVKTGAKFCSGCGSSIQG